MAEHRPFRFGASTHGTETAGEWRELARTVEDLGFSTLLLSDHVGNVLSPVPAMAVAAEATTTLRVGTLVLCNDFRHAVFQAKELATLDVLSGGRLEIGLGAGWLPRDYEQSGIPMESNGRRVGRLEESIAVMKALFGDGPVDHDGVNWCVRALDGVPKPLQRPHPPLLVGGSRPRMLALAGREADIVGIAPSLTTKPLFGKPPRETPEQAVDRQVAEVRRAAADRPDAPELNVVANPAGPVQDPRARAGRVATRQGIDVGDVLTSPHVLLGTRDGICDTLRERRERWGISYVTVPAHRAKALAPIVAELAGT